MSVQLTAIEVFCVDHVKLARWYQRILGLEFLQASGDIEFLSDGETRILFCQGKPDTYKNSTLYFTVDDDDFEAIEQAIHKNNGVKVQDLGVVEEYDSTAVYSSLYEDIEGNVLGLFVERPR